MAEGLTNKQQAFIEEYLACGFNASEAARRAGYTGKPNVVGPRLLANVSIQATIRQALADRAMPADEVLARLAEHARGNIGAFIATNDDGVPSGFSLSNDRPLHMVKKVTVTEKGWSFEMYDAQAALVHLGKHHGLFTNDDDDWRKALAQLGYNAADLFEQLTGSLAAASAQGAQPPTE